LEANSPRWPLNTAIQRTAGLTCLRKFPMAGHHGHSGCPWFRRIAGIMEFQPTTRIRSGCSSHRRKNTRLNPTSESPEVSNQRTEGTLSGSTWFVGCCIWDRGNLGLAAVALLGAARATYIHSYWDVALLKRGERSIPSWPDSIASICNAHVASTRKRA